MIQDPTNQYIATIMSHCTITGREVLEIGCGKGRITRDLAAHAAKVVATDPDAEALETAKVLITGENVTFLHAPTGVPHPSVGSFDVALYTLSLHHVPPGGMSASLASTARLLKDNGVIVVIEPGDGGSFTTAKERFGAGSGDERPAREAAIRTMRALDGWAMGEVIIFRTLFQFDGDEDFFTSMFKGHVKLPAPFRGEVRRFLDHHRTEEGIILDAERRLNVLRRICV